MNYIFDHAPNLKIVMFGNGDGLIFTVLGNQFDLVLAHGQSFDCELAVESGDYNVIALGFDGAINYQNVIVENSGIDHGVAVNSHTKCTGAVFD
jgi:hypothetical protein